MLLLDEPVSGMNPTETASFMQLLNKIHDSGITMLLVEQNIHRALDFVQRAYIIENGRIVLEGDRNSLLGDKDFSSKFLGLD